MAVPLSARSSVVFAGLKDAVGGPVNFQAMTIQLPSYVLANILQMDATPAGMLAFVPDANGGAGAVVYSDGTIWKDVGTNALVA